VECPDTIDGIVPDVKGLGAREAVALLEAQGLKVKIHGQGHVQRQSVAAGTKAVNGAKVELYLETNTHKKK
jgi:cell division protein FtsI (penicillin-binding protein 3)